MKNGSDDMSNCKEGTGTHDWQLQKNDCNHQLHAAEYHQEESQFPKADAKGDQEILVSEDLQTKNYNRLTIKWSKAVSEEENPQTTPKTSSNLKAIMCDVDVTPQLTPKRTYTDVTSSQKAFQNHWTKHVAMRPYAMTMLCSVTPLR